MVFHFLNCDERVFHQKGPTVGVGAGSNVDFKNVMSGGMAPACTDYAMFDLSEEGQQVGGLAIKQNLKRGSFFGV